MPTGLDRSFGDYIKRLHGGSAMETVATAVAMNNDMLDSMNINRWNRWIELAAKIERHMAGKRPAKFSLYDYLDSVANSRIFDWENIVELNKEYNLFPDNIWEEIVEITKKRYDRAKKPTTQEKTYNTVVFVTDVQKKTRAVKLLQLPQEMTTDGGATAMRHLAKIAAEKLGVNPEAVTWGDVAGMKPDQFTGTNVNAQDKPATLVLSGRNTQPVAPKTRYEQHIVISRDEMMRIKECMAGVKKQGPHEAIIHITVFPDNSEMHIICAPEYTDGPSIAEARLYRPNNLAYAAKTNMHSFAGTWSIEHDRTEYNVIVSVSKH